MPQLYGDIVAVSKEELVGPNLFPSLKALYQKLWRDKDLAWGIKRFIRGGGNHPLEVNYDTLPKRYQEHIPDPRIADHPLDNYYQVERETTDFYNGFKYPDGNHLLSDTIDQLIIDASMLKALIKWEADRLAKRQLLGNSSKRGVLKTVFEDAHDYQDTLKKNHGVNHSLNTSYKRFKEQYNAFKSDSYVAIIKDPFGKSKKNAQKRTVKINKLLRNLLAGRTTKPTPTEVAREYEAFQAGYIDIVNKKTGELYNPKDYGKISSRTITMFLETWDSKIGTDAKRSGNRQKLINAKIPHYSFEKPVLAGSIISIDDRQPPFEYEKGKRMWWYIGIDVASEAIIAWAYGKTKEELILNFYRNLAENCNKWNVQIPAEVECESHLNSSFTDSFLADGAMFEKVTMYRNNARSKIIERFFGELRYRYEKEHIGWLARPHARSEANQSRPGKKQIIPYDRLVQQCFSDIVKWNNSPKKGTKIGRFDYFLQHQNPDLETTNYKSFMKHLAPSRKTSCNAGIVQLNRQEWLLGSENKIATGEELVSLMRKVEGKMIDVRFLKDADGNIYKTLAYHPKDNRLLCELLPKPKGMRGFKEETPEHKAAELILSKYATTVKAYMISQKNTIEEVEVINHKPQTISDSFSIPGLSDTLENCNPATQPQQLDEPAELPEEEEYEFENEYAYSNKAIENL